MQTVDYKQGTKKVVLAQNAECKKVSCNQQGDWYSVGSHDFWHYRWRNCCCDLLFFLFRVSSCFLFLFLLQHAPYCIQAVQLGNILMLVITYML